MILGRDVPNFYISHPNAAQLSALLRAYYDRIAFNDRTVPYYTAVRLKKGELSVSLMREVIRIFMENAQETA